MYNAYIKQILAPAMKPGDIVIADNLNVHKSELAKQFVESMGASYVSLPPYSPDLNPIEKMWSKIKQFLRGAKARTREVLERAISSALDTITPEDVEGCYIHH